MYKTPFYYNQLGPVLQHYSDYSTSPTHKAFKQIRSCTTQFYKGWYFEDYFTYIITWFNSLQIHFTSGSVKVTHSKCCTPQFPLRMQWIISLTLPDCFFHLSLRWQKKLVWWHSQYRVVSAYHNFYDALISKINTTMMYIQFVILLFSVMVQSSAKPNES